MALRRYFEFLGRFLPGEIVRAEKVNEKLDAIQTGFDRVEQDVVSAADSLVQIRGAAEAARDAAQNSKIAAANSETSALSSKNAAAGSATAAAGSATLSTTERTAAQTARQGAEAARDAALGHRNAASASATSAADSAAAAEVTRQQVDAALANGPVLKVQGKSPSAGNVQLTPADLGALSADATALAAAKLATPRNITLQGAIAAAFAFDGSANASANVTLNFGATTTAGTADWNHVSNTMPGAGPTLLMGNATNGPSGSAHYFHVLNFEYSTKNGTGNVTQLAIPYGGHMTTGIYMRGRFSGAWTDWVKLLDSSAIAAAATKLATARTLSLTGDATGSMTFDGTANASTALTLANSGVTAGAFGSSSAIPVVTVDAKGRVTNVSTAAIGNAPTATKLATPRAIAISGDGTGTANFDGSAAINIALALANSGVTAGSYGGSTKIPVLTVNAKGLITGISSVDLASVSTADKLTTPRNITLQGGASGGATFDGTTNATINVTVDPAQHLHDRIRFMDTRAVNDAPQAKPGYAITADFKTIANAGNPPVQAGWDYAHIVTVAGWSTNELSGGLPTQLSFGDGLAVRQATSATAWGPWRNVLTDKGGYIDNSRLVITRNGQTVDNGMYGNVNMELKSLGGGLVGLGFHRGGYTAATIYHSGPDSLRVRHNSGMDGEILTSANTNGFLQFRGFATDDNAAGQGIYNIPVTGASNCMLTFNAGGSTGQVQLTFTYQGGFSYRNKTDDTTWNPWKAVLTDANYASYTVPKAGGVFSGNVGIHAPVAVLSVRDTDTAGANIAAYVSLQDSGGVERGWMGYGTNNGVLTIRNAAGGATIMAATGSIRGDAPAGFATSGWFRSEGNTGWYSSDYAGGIHMSDVNYVRVYNGKGFAVEGHTLLNGQVDVGLTQAEGQVRIGYSGQTNQSYVYRNSSLALGGHNSALGNLFTISNSRDWTLPAALSVTGAITSSNNITAYSDERLKADWRALPDNFLERLAGIKHGSYMRSDLEDAPRQVGVSAQALRELLPEAVIEAGDERGTLSVAYGNAALVACVALAKQAVEQQERLRRLEVRLSELEAA